MEREIENKIINKEENIPDENQNIEHSTIINSNNMLTLTIMKKIIGRI